MLQKNYTLNEGGVSTIQSTFENADYIAPKKSTGLIQLNTALTIYASIEFLAVACSAYLGSAVYHFASFGSLQAAPKYILAAVGIASLVLLFSIGFRNFFAFRRQARHIFLWSGIGSVALAFSAFLTVLFSRSPLTLIHVEV